ncbi:translation initiation factor eIF3 subunit g, partial [Perkinsus olseni]
MTSLMTTGRWADEDPISPSNRDVPPKSETDIDPETGLKTITEYEERDGAVYKINRVVKVTTVRVTCSKAEADRRRRWTPFGKAVETKKNNTFANRTEDEINLEPSKLTGASAAA